MRRRARHHGYVLILTLVALTIAGTLLAAACRGSLRKAMLAARAERELQLRWGSLSCRAILLPQAERIFEQQTAPTPAVRREVRLGRERFALIFADEQAKANVNTLWRAGRADAERGIRAITQASGLNIPVELRPVAQPPDDNEEQRPVFTGLGQIFGGVTPEKLSGPAVDSLTCWGDGTLNFTRASRAALTAVCEQYIGGAGVERLLKFRDEQPEASYVDALAELKLTERNRTAVEDLLTDSSTCHSLWVVAGGSQHELSVLDGMLEQNDGLITFTW